MINPSKPLVKRSVIILSIATLTVCGAALLYLILAPVMMRGASAFRPRALDLDAARNYYTVLSAAVASIVGATGLILGGFYYIHRLRWEELRSARELKVERLNELVQRIESIDQSVSELAFLRPDDEAGSGRTHKIIQSLGSMAELLDHAADLNAIGDATIKAVIRFYSYVETWCRGRLETSPNMPTGTLGHRLIDSEEYADRLHDARRALHESVKNLIRAA